VPLRPKFFAENNRSAERNQSLFDRFLSAEQQSSV
jgi:hypothetical protein